LKAYLSIIINVDENSRIRCDLLPGQLVLLTFNSEILSEVEFSTMGHRKNGQVFFQKIMLDSWPSWNDFFGPEVIVKEGDVATIIKKAGRPLQICYKPKWAIYDVYDVLINGRICQAFRCHLLPVNQLDYQVSS